jgi:transcription elongation factor S-II
VTDLRKHPLATEEIKEKAKNLVAKWKQDLGRGDSGSTRSRTPSEPSTPAPIVDRTVASDKLKVLNLGDKVRMKCTEMLYNALATGTEEDSKHVLYVAEQVERAVFDQFEASDNSYKSRMRSLVSNLRDKHNPFLKLKVLGDKISAKEFAKMTPEQMMSKDRKAVVEEAQKANLADAVSATAQHAETDMFKCGKCGKRRTTYFQMQTRSAGNSN